MIRIGKPNRRQRAARFIALALLWSGPAWADRAPVMLADTTCPDGRRLTLQIARDAIIINRWAPDSHIPARARELEPWAFGIAPLMVEEVCR